MAPRIFQLQNLTLPARCSVAALSGCVLLSGLLAMWNPLRVERSYREVLESALAQQDIPKASVAAQRLLSLSTENQQEALLLFARVRLAAGDDREAASVFDLIAPRDKPGYGPAHLFLAEEFLRRAGSDRSGLQLASQHARQALKLDPDSIEALLCLARASARQKQWVEARKAFEKAAEKDPRFIPELLPILQLLGDQKAVAEWSSRTPSQDKKSGE